jgi:spore coat protein CotF|tara:strand:+ start:614 stop:832 length:219 start_codon:yes stop_codon:yes gene_type:complete
MVTTIQVSNDLQDELNKRKIFDRETYEEVIWDILEDTMELSEQTKKDIEQARKEIKQGKFKSLEQVKKELGL